METAVGLGIGISLLVVLLLCAGGGLLFYLRSHTDSSYPVPEELSVVHTRGRNGTYPIYSNANFTKRFYILKRIKPQDPIGPKENAWSSENRRLTPSTLLLVAGRRKR